MLWTEVWPTRAPKGVRSAPGLWLSRPRIRSWRGRVRVRLFVVVGNLKIQSVSLSVNVNTTDATTGATALLLPAQNTHTLHDPI